MMLSFSDLINCIWLSDSNGWWLKSVCLISIILGFLIYSTASFLVTGWSTKSGGYDFTSRIHCDQHGFSSFSPHIASRYCLSWFFPCNFPYQNPDKIIMYSFFFFCYVLSIEQLAVLMVKLPSGNLGWGRGWPQSHSRYLISRLAH